MSPWCVKHSQSHNTQLTICRAVHRQHPGFAGKTPDSSWTDSSIYGMNGISTGMNADHYVLALRNWEIQAVLIKTNHWMTLTGFEKSNRGGRKLFKEWHYSSAGTKDASRTERGQPVKAHRTSRFSNMDPEGHLCTWTPRAERGHGDYHFLF